MKVYARSTCCDSFTVAQGHILTCMLILGNESMHNANKGDTPQPVVTRKLLKPKRARRDSR